MVKAIPTDCIVHTTFLGRLTKFNEGAPDSNSLTNGQEDGSVTLPSPN
jgi:hypothetical protein